MLGQGQVKTRTLAVWGLGPCVGGTRLLLWIRLLEVSQRGVHVDKGKCLSRGCSSPSSLCLGNRLHHLRVPRLTPCTSLLYLRFKEWPVARMWREA